MERTDLIEVESGRDIQTEGLDKDIINATVVVDMEDGLDRKYESGMLVPRKETSSSLEFSEELNDLPEVQAEELFAIPDVIPETSNAVEMFVSPHSKQYATSSKFNETHMGYQYIVFKP